MKIVVLDGCTLNPGDTPWDELRTLGDVTIHERTSPQEVLPRAAGAAILLTNKVLLNASHFPHLPDLRFIAVTAAGYNCVDIPAARDHHIAVSNVPIYSTDAVAQFVFALLLHHTSHVALHNAAVHAGDWAACPDFSFSKIPLTELAGKTLGIVGLGRIGKRVADIAHAFGMRLLVTTRTPPQNLSVPLDLVPLPNLVASSDFISLHCPLTPDTQNLINAHLLAHFKPSAVLINTSRGGLLNEPDVAAALHKKQLAALLADVVSIEPIRPDNPLLHAPNVTLTPHNAWATVEARRRLMQSTLENIRTFQTGAPINTVT